MQLRINKFIAASMQTSRRAAEQLILAGEVKLNGRTATLTDRVLESDSVTCSGTLLSWPESKVTLLKLNKPVGYVCSHARHKDSTIFDLLPAECSKLKIVGRLDKDTSGLVLLTSSGDLAHSLMHPKFKKKKVYQAKLNKELTPQQLSQIQNSGVDIGEDRKSRFGLKPLGDFSYELILEEGRNRQIRRTFKALGIDVLELKRLSLGEYSLGNLKEGEWEGA